MDGTYVTLEKEPPYFRRWLWDEIFKPWRPHSLERFCEQHPEICNGVEREFPPVIDPPWKELAAGSAISALISSVAYPNPDGDGPDPDGPAGPIMHDILVALSAVQLAGSLADRELAFELQGVAAKVAQVQMGRLQEAISD